MLCSDTIAAKCIWQKETTCKKLRWEELSVGNLNKLDSQNELEGFGRTQITFLNSYCKCKCYFIRPLELDHPGQPPGNHTHAVTFTAAEMGVKVAYILCNSKPIIKVIHLQINHPCYEAPSKRNKIRACELGIVCEVQILLPSLSIFKPLTRIWSPRELLISFKSGEVDTGIIKEKNTKNQNKSIPKWITRFIR